MDVAARSDAAQYPHAEFEKPTVPGVRRIPHTGSS